MSHVRTLIFGALRVLVTAGLLVATLASGSVAAAAPSAPAPAPTQAVARTVLSGHRVPGLAHASVVRATDSTRQLQITLALQTRNPAQLQSLIRAQRDPHAASFRKYLSADAYAAQFAPTQASVDAVVAFLAQQGLQVKSVSRNRLLITAAGSVDAIQRAFQVQLADVQLARGRVAHTPLGEPSVPSTLAGLVQGVAGLSDAARPRAHLQRPKTKTGPRLGSGPTGGYTPADLLAAYDLTELPNGAGQNVALVEFDTYDPRDIAQFSAAYTPGTPNIVNHPVDGGVSSPADGALEVELDIDAVAGIAPAATQHVYMAPIDAPTGQIDIYNQIVSDNLANVVSTSWGDCEAYQSPSDMAVMDAIFSQGAAQGMAFFAAAGDSGAYDCWDDTLAVDFPASDPWVVGVGGSTLFTGSGGTYQSEAAWNSDWGAGGGGLSAVFSRPDYQVGPGVQNAYSNGMRQVPDVSAEADPNTGYTVYCTIDAAYCDPSYGWTNVGGTSLAAPLWAAAVADINAYLEAHGKPAVGDPHTTLYRLASSQQAFAPYHDVTVGNNMFYPATVGYDLATGLGTPDGFNIARDLAGQSAPLVTTLPAPTRLADTRTSGGAIASGSARCFAVAGQAGIPADAGAVVLNVTAVGQTTSGWLTLYPSGQAVPSTSTLNFGTTQYAIANGAITALGPDGSACVTVGTITPQLGSAQAVLDVTGYLSTAALAQLDLLPSPVRLVDTRAAGGAIATGSSRCFQTAGVGSVPANASALLVNVTAVEYSTNGWLTLYPNGQPVPSSSTVNFDPSEYAVANNTIVAVGSGGQICVNVGTVGSVPGGSQVIIDAVGYLTTAGLAQLSMLGTPQRVADTRQDGGPIAAGTSRCFQVAGVDGVPANATSVVANIAAVSYPASGWLTVYPNGQPLPATSTLNFDTSDYAIANGAILAIGNGGKVCVNVGTLRNVPGSSHVILDVTGYQLH